MPKALIVYASWTGNTKEIAEILKKKFLELEVDADLVECQQTDASAFQSVDICVVAVYTFGSQGALPDEIEDFYFDLEKENLEGKVFGVLGSGEEIYDFYCKSVDDFDKQFEKTKAVRGAKSLKIEENAKPNDEIRIDEFAQELLKTYKTLVS